ncbi:hypothetical protein XBJ1_1902 [Xenorhabdus bovienii SS-2004]|uniref:Uncharacterized protein n=1 Tax=Xenorhabdus bovienii (strain SS-2004) TaxID=406818 RepID=D3V2R3_XENBS|nr:hypothetical protein XBJ1_1902 [Xenorhabdus bovienii SS-2004]
MYFWTLQDSCYHPLLLVPLLILFMLAVFLIPPQQTQKSPKKHHEVQIICKQIVIVIFSFDKSESYR